jgi:hypothetical protein
MRTPSPTIYTAKCFGSLRNNKATFDLLSQLLTKAEHENTAKVQEENATITHRKLIGMCSTFCQDFAELFETQSS